MSLKPLFPTVDLLGLSTDLYELTMAAAYFESGRRNETATFELFTRRLPGRRNFLVAAGLEQALHYALNVTFTQEALEYLRGLEVFKQVDPSFFSYLADFKFTGDVWALPEGTIFFENEPLLQVTGPVIEAQILETFLINSVNVQTTVASKAARMCIASRGRTVIDFGSRRAHGPQAGVLAARAAFIGGCQGTSNVLAGYELGIPVYGTMAHSFVQFFDSENEAFKAFQRTFPKDSILLVDTFDTEEGVREALRLGRDFKGIRIDSGDLAQLSRKARRMLDEAGRTEAKIFASGDLTEDLLESFARQELPIDAYGVGTDLVVSSDSPYCDFVYKLVEVSRQGRREPKFKLSPSKNTLPFAKQVYRTLQDGFFEKDTVDRREEAPPSTTEAVPLLEQFLSKGELTKTLPALPEAREFAREQLERLPAEYKRLDSDEAYTVEIGAGLRRAMARFGLTANSDPNS